MNNTHHIRYAIILLTGLCLAGCKTTPQISYQRDVQPIFVGKCIDCHTPPYGAGYRQTGLNLESYTSLMKGSIYGPVVVAGNSKTSPLNMLVEGRAGDLSRQMEISHTPMTEHEIEVLQLWVEQGAPDN
jgi:hypothetical protein